jgi:hypothetical protein
VILPAVKITPVKEESPSLKSKMLSGQDLTTGSRIARSKEQTPRYTKVLIAASFVSTAVVDPEVEGAASQ